MKKKIILWILCAFALSGCQSVSALDAYQAASEKTDQIQMGKNKMEGTVLIESGEIQKDLSFDLRGTFDHTKSQLIYDGTIESEDMGEDFTFYQEDDEKRYLYIPMLGKYILLTNVNAEVKDVQLGDLTQSFEEVGAYIQSILKDENVFKGERVLISNEDGDVKATKYTIKLSPQQLQGITDILYKTYDENQAAINEWLMSVSQISEENILSFMQSNLQIDSFEMTAFVDFDQYVISEDFAVGIASEHQKILLNYHLERWSNDGEVNLSFPAFTDAEIMTLEEGGL